MIVDEIDAPVFNDVQEFYDNTKYVNLHVIGLTATAFHGEKDGVEAGTLAALEYQVYKNNETIQTGDPKIDKRVKLGDTLKWKHLIEQHCPLQPMLIYALGQEYAWIS
jgi:hypothetical protein